MTPDEYAAKRRARDRARYLAQRTERLAKAREQYQGNTAFREQRKAYARGYDAGKRKAAKEAAESFADFTVTSATPTTQQGTIDQ
jgi:hypothetical protein